MSVDSFDVDTGILNSEGEPNKGEIVVDGDMAADYLDSGVFQLDSVDSNLTVSEDDNIAQLLSSCTDEIVKSLDSISNLSIEQGDFNLQDFSFEIQNSKKSNKVPTEEAKRNVCENVIVTENTGVTDSYIDKVSDTDNYTKTFSTERVPKSEEEEKISKSESPNKIESCETEFPDDLDVSESEVPNGIPKSTISKSTKKSGEKTKRSSQDRKKRKAILQALEINDTESLIRAAVSCGGLLSDDIRRKVWPKLVGVDIVETAPRPSKKEIESHKYYEQVVMDVNRSLQRFPPSIKEIQRLKMLDQLVFLIMRILCCHPEMHYYQGYHDICVTFLLVLGEETAFHVVEKLSRTHLSVFMEESMDPTIYLLEHMYTLIGRKNPVLKNFMIKSDVGIGFCLSWLITWFGHVLNDYDTVVRLFDFFIVSHPWMPMYLTAAVIIHRRDEVLKQECDMAFVHSLLANIPDDLPFEDLIFNSIGLHSNYDPKMLAIERPYVKRPKRVSKRKLTWSQYIKNTVKSVVPSSNVVLPIAIATAVVVTAYFYQSYNY